jgi:hypothetical protein
MDLVVAFVLGMAASLLASFAYWAYFRGLLIPRTEFSDEIVRSAARDRAEYHVVVRNKSRRRGILEPRILCTYRATLDGASHLSVWNIPLSNQQVLRIAPGSNRIVSLQLHRMSNFALDAMPDNVARLIRDQREGALDALFALGANSRIMIEMIGYDELSGERKYLASSRYEPTAE